MSSIYGFSENFKSDSPSERKILRGQCKRCGKLHEFDSEKCRPKARAIFPDGTVKEWIVKASSKIAVFICECGTWGVAKEVSE